MQLKCRVASGLAALALLSCTPEDKAPERIWVPEHFPTPHFNFAGQFPSEEEISLGRKLFYDPILSLDSSISCANCHSQPHAFADHNMPFSFGVGGAQGSRNAPGLFNLAWHESFMHDGGINHLELVPMAPITDEREMNLPLVEALKRVAQNSDYSAAFDEVYGGDTITTERLFKALTAFQLSLVSATAKYDKVMLGESDFSPLEEQGYDLFMESCASCHAPPLFSDFSYANNGLDSVFTDPGRGGITLQPQDSGLFKVPSLRNAMLTYPFMHDGRFTSMDQVLEHYATLHLSDAAMDSRLENLVINEQDKDALKTFLETLTDYEFISDLRHSEPAE